MKEPGAGSPATCIRCGCSDDTPCGIEGFTDVGPCGWTEINRMESRGLCTFCTAWLQVDNGDKVAVQNFDPGTGETRPSHVAAVRYAGGGRLIVWFDGGGVYEYLGVGKPAAVAMIVAPSKGKFLAAYIRGRFNYRKIVAAEENPS